MTAFARARWAGACAILLALVSMALYPGGTPLDRSSNGYSVFHNFLSDLGMTVAYDGRSNRAGAILFVLGVMLAVLGLGGALFAVIRLYAASPRSRPFARAAGAAGVLVSIAFIGVAATPENRVMSWHLGLTLAAFRVFPLVSFLLWLASLRSTVFPRSVANAWAALTVVLVGYVVVLTWGPAPTVPDGLLVQAGAQKLVALIAGATFAYLTVEGDRALRKPRPTPSPAPAPAAP